MTGRRVVVTGVGAVTPLGNGAPCLWEGLLEGRSGIGPIASFDTENFPVKFGGECRDFDPLQHQSRKDIRHTDRYAQFAIAAAEEARADAQLDTDKLDGDRWGAVLGSGIGGVSSLAEQQVVLHERGARRVSPFLVPKLMLNSAPGLLAIRFGFSGPNFAVASACASSNHAIGLAYQTIALGQADGMLTGGSEAALGPIAFAGFCQARALSRRNDKPAAASRPFDVNRDGFVFGEGAGLLVLEELEHARRRGAPIYAEVLGFGMSDDAHHITAPHAQGRGAARAMKLALDSAHCEPTRVGYINAHGTSTPLGDKAESLAINKVFGAHTPDIAVSSTKSMAGHLLGASGGIEAIAVVKSLQTGLLHPTVNVEEQDPECAIDCVANTARERVVDVALSNSFGFGGHNTTVAFSRYDGDRSKAL